MKVKMTIELELPDETPEVLAEYRESLGQLLFDEYVNYATCNHLKDALKWCAKGKVGSDDEDPRAKLIYQHHDTWGDICNNAKWDFEVVE
jgi:hypothetical protein